MRVIQRYAKFFLMALALSAGGSAVAVPPSVPFFSVYRTYPDQAVRLPISASDPDGTPLLYISGDLPEGATLDELSGLLEWMPTAAQVGDWEVSIEVRDEDLESTLRVLLFQVSPVDSCNVPSCDPALGCTPNLPPLPEAGEPSSACCVAEPNERVAEPSSPAVECPLIETLYLGRNRLGFGRIQNCDKLQIFSFAQGGTTIRFHVEARCVTDEVGLEVQMHRVSGEGESLVFDRVLACPEPGAPECVPLVFQPDGFGRALQLNFDVTSVDAFELEGEEVELWVRLTDLNGVVLERSQRLTLTLQDLAELPNPDIGDDPADEAGCVGCHRPLDGNGQRVGIEEMHPAVSLGCTDCHGGNGNASTRFESHVPPGEGDPAFIRDLASDRLDQISPAYLRFINPGDLRVAAQSCGASGCHPEHVASVPLSVMSTYAGHYTLPRFLAGSQDHGAILAAVDVVDPNYDAATAPPGAVERLHALREPDPLADRSRLDSVMDAYLPKSCPTCHLNAFGKNDSPGSYRSSGCSACHVLYADDGLSRSADPVEPRDLVRHPMRHELTTQIPTEQCAHCHFQGGRIGLAYRGIREGGFSPEKTPENGVTLGQTLYGHGPNYYFSDEDDTNEIDETPPDLHHEAGMVCMDCHVGGDVHGDGNLYASERFQVGSRCEDCHGSVRSVAEPDPEDGLFKNSKGFPLRGLTRNAAGAVFLELATQPGVVLGVPQVKQLIDSGLKPAMTSAMGIDSNGFSHTDSLECYACHTSWRQTCFGCHVTQNDRFGQRNETTGIVTQGAFAAVRDDYSLDFYALGINERGKISPLCNSMSLLLSYTDVTGTSLYTDAVRTSHEGRRGFGWNPFHHHTVSRMPQTCDRCHPVTRASDPPNAARLAETYGYGNGTATVTVDSEVLDLTGFLDGDGNLVSEFPHPNTGPVPAEVRERALAVVVPEPGTSWLRLSAVVLLAGLVSRLRRTSRRVALS